MDENSNSSIQRQPTLVIRANSGWALVDLREVWMYKDLFVALGERELKLRYRQTVLGIAWVILQPLLGAAIFSIVFNVVGQIRSPAEGIPYFLLSYTGMVAWGLFSGTLTKSSSSLVQNAALISKVYFPRLILPLSVALSALVDFLVACSVLVMLMVFFRISPTFAVILLPVWFVVLLLLGIGIGLFASSLMVKYRDVQHILPVFVQLLLYASPVGYTLGFALSRTPVDLQPFFYLNPLSGILEAFRWSILGTPSPSPPILVYAIISSIAVFVSGTYFFKETEKRFADVI